MVDSSNFVIGVHWQQRSADTGLPISFFTKKLSKAATRYSTIGQELMAVYQTIRLFRHSLEGRLLHMLTDHKPLIGAIQTKLDSPHELRHLDFIRHFTTDIRHIKSLQRQTPFQGTSQQPT